ncbi:hypothetical protein WJX72_007922 [[Myrmecia] bisecta]|uniref:Peptidase S8/S53 domain-containing protein n=1 Tax=[Myrmecia] bisecta TaxID=41462 RepID=A0AAW1PYV9_9CHLO
MTGPQLQALNDTQFTSSTSQDQPYTPKEAQAAIARIAANLAYIKNIINAKPADVTGTANISDTARVSDGQPNPDIQLDANGNDPLAVEFIPDPTMSGPGYVIPVSGFQHPQLETFGEREAFRLHPNRLLVKLKPNATIELNTTSPAPQKGKAGIEAVEYYSTVDTYLVNITDGANATTKIKELQKDPDVLYVEPDYASFTQFADGTGTYNLYGLDKIQAPCAWSLYGAGNPNVTVCVIDSGVNVTHLDLVGNLWVNPRDKIGDGIDNDSNGCVDDKYGCGWINGAPVQPFDDYVHGSHCSGTIAALKNKKGMAGVGQVKVMTCKFMNSQGVGYNSDAINCINYCAKNFKAMGQIGIYSSSWGCQNCPDTTLKTTIQNTPGLFLFAAGNYGNNMSGPDTTLRFYPASYMLPNSISVGASDARDTRATFSNYGKTTCDIMAPGNMIYSTVLTGTGWGWMSGTSMAAPQVAGAAAMLLSYFPSLTVARLKAALLASVDPIPALNGTCATGGRLNLYNAVNLLKSQGVPMRAGLIPDPEGSCSAPPAGRKLLQDLQAP